MIADIHAQGFVMIKALAYHMWRWSDLVLRLYSDRVQRVSVGVGDKNGPRGEVDKFCRIQIHPIGAPVALIKDVGADLYALIDRVICRNLDRTQRVRDAARYCRGIQKPTHAHGEIK